MIDTKALIFNIVLDKISSMISNDSQDLYEQIKNSENIVIATHVNPDPDTLSSAIAMSHLLRRLNKKHTLFNVSDKLPTNLEFLDGYLNFRKTIPVKCDFIIAVDAATFRRLGIEKPEVLMANIDHHKSNELYGDFNVVDNECSSTTQVIYNLFNELNIKINAKMAEALYVGLLDDTSCFIAPSTNSNSLEMASTLSKTAIDVSKIAQHVRMNKSLATLRLTAILLGKMALYEDGQIASVVATSNEFSQSGASADDTETAQNEMLYLATVKVAIVLRESDIAKKVRISLRSKDDIDVSKIASKYNGGGHAHAGGFSISHEDIYELEQILIKQIKEIL